MVHNIHDDASDLIARMYLFFIHKYCTIIYIKFILTFYSAITYANKPQAGVNMWEIEGHFEDEFSIYDHPILAGIDISAKKQVSFLLFYLIFIYFVYFSLLTRHGNLF